MQSPDAKLKTLSGKDLLRIFAGYDFHEFSQKGSHIKPRRALPSRGHQTLTIGKHVELDRGTLGAIYRQALRFIAQEELRKHFYSG